MHCVLSESQEAIVARISQVSKLDTSNHTEQLEDQGGFPMIRWHNLCASGVLGVIAPSEYGGEEQNLLTLSQSIRAVARNCNDEGLVFSLCAHLTTCVVPIIRYGTEAQKRRLLPKLLTGQLIGGNGTTEADAGSDLGAIKTTAQKWENGYSLHGKKNFVTNGSIADVLIIYAKHVDGIKYANISAFIVESDYPGFIVEGDWRKFGLSSSPLSRVELDGCRLPIESLLGRERHGLSVFNESMLWERVIMAAYHVGSMERQFNGTLLYARNRRQFDSAISQFQGVSYRLVEMRKTIETASALLTQTCVKHELGSVRDADAALLKLHTSEGKVANSTLAASIFGAYGYTEDAPVGIQLRDSLAATIYSGTSDTQKRIVAEALEEYQ